MQEIVVSRTIAASAQDIWDALTALDDVPAILRSVESVERLTEGEFGAGTRWRRTRTMLGRSESHEMRVIAAETPRHVLVESEFAGLGYQLHIDLAESGDHTESRPRTSVRIRIREQPPQPDMTVVQRVFGTLGARATEETLAEDLADIAAAVERPDTSSMVVIHRLFTRELTAGPDLVRSVLPDDRQRAEVVADHLTVVLDALVDHHHGEDVLIWPLMRCRIDLSDEVLGRMESQHRAIHDDVDGARASLDEWRRSAEADKGERLAEILTRLAANLRTHLEQEENDMLPLMEQHLTRVEYDRLATHSRESLPRDKAALIVQMFLEGASPGERARLIAEYPLATQLLINTVGARQYRRHVRRLRTP